MKVIEFKLVLLKSNYTYSLSNMIAMYFTDQIRAGNFDTNLSHSDKRKLWRKLYESCLVLCLSVSCFYEGFISISKINKLLRRYF